MVRPTGGRGKKELYETTHVRVPKPILEDVKRVIDRFHEFDVDAFPDFVTSLDEAKAIAKKIILNKKSAKVSMEKLLTALYGQDVKL